MQNISVPMVTDTDNPRFFANEQAGSAITTGENLEVVWAEFSTLS